MSTGDVHVTVYEATEDIPKGITTMWEGQGLTIQHPNGLKESVTPEELVERGWWRVKPSKEEPDIDSYNPRRLLFLALDRLAEEVGGENVNVRKQAVIAVVNSLFPKPHHRERP
jgi:hypothetical protein